MTEIEFSGGESGGAPRRVAIVGLGLMGGSLARALRASAAPPHVVGWSYTAAEGEAALAAGVVERIATGVDDAVDGADLVVLATPVESIVAMLGRFTSVLARVPAVTDLASVKGPVMAAARAAGLTDRFVGGHPLAGRHERGFAASRAELYQDALVYLVQEAEYATQAMRTVAAMWRSVGARPRVVDAAAHDTLLAWTSHLPQAVAFALGAALSAADVRVDELGPGGLDTTRLAASPSQLWADIFLHNTAALAEPLKRLREHIALIEQALVEEDVATLLALFEASSRWRDTP
ncbi:MAG: prephenate dehydrogenase [Gemmatimonadota bacterium]